MQDHSETESPLNNTDQGDGQDTNSNSSKRDTGENSIYEMEPFNLSNFSVGSRKEAVGETDDNSAESAAENTTGTTSIYEMQPFVLPDSHVDQAKTILTKEQEQSDSQVLEAYDQFKQKRQNFDISSPFVGGILNDRYQVVGVVGVGNMAVVYKARDLQSGRVVALKTCRPEFGGDNELARFRREIDTHSRLSHENIVEFIESMDVDGQLFLVMENVKGISLADILEMHGPIRNEETIWRILQQVCSALQYAHGKGVIHRDLKTSNVVLSKRVDELIEVKVLDFGIAQLEDKKLSRLTLEGLAIGSPLYMSPEQTEGKELTYASDIYSLGTLMYEMVAGAHPYTDYSIVELIKAHCDITVNPDSLVEKCPDFPGVEMYDAIVRKSMATIPRARQQSAAELSEDLYEWISMVRSKGPHLSIARTEAESDESEDNSPRTASFNFNPGSNENTVATPNSAASGSGSSSVRGKVRSIVEEETYAELTDTFISKKSAVIFTVIVVVLCFVGITVYWLFNIEQLQALREMIFSALAHY